MSRAKKFFKKTREVISKLALLVIGILGLFLIGLYCSKAGYGEQTLKFTVSVIGVCVIAGSVYLSIREFRKNRSFERINALNLDSNNGLQVARTIRFIEMKLENKEGQPITDIYTEVRKEEEHEAAILYTLGLFDDFAIWMRKKIIYDDLLRDALGFTILRIFLSLYPYIREVREKRNNQHAYIELQRRVVIWIEEGHLDFPSEAYTVTLKELKEHLNEHSDGR